MLEGFTHIISFLVLFLRYFSNKILGHGLILQHWKWQSFKPHFEVIHLHARHVKGMCTPIKQLIRYDCN